MHSCTVRDGDRVGKFQADTSANVANYGRNARNTGCPYINVVTSSRRSAD